MERAGGGETFQVVLVEARAAREIVDAFERTFPAGGGDSLRARLR